MKQFQVTVTYLLNGADEKTPDTMLTYATHQLEGAQRNNWIGELVGEISIVEVEDESKNISPANFLRWGYDRWVKRATDAGHSPGHPYSTWAAALTLEQIVEVQQDYERANLITELLESMGLEPSEDDALLDAVSITDLRNLVEAAKATE